MDDNSRRRSPDELPYSTQGPRSNDNPRPSLEFSTSSSNRFGPPAFMSAPSSSRVSGGVATYPSYYQEPTSSFPSGLPAAPQPFQPNYSQVQRQQQGFGMYNPDLMYGASSQAAPGAVYTPTQESRLPASMQMLPELSGGFPRRSASSASALQHHASTSSGIYTQPQSSANRSLQQGYPSSMSMGAVSQTPAEVMGQGALHPSNTDVITEYAVYNTTLREIFQGIINGRLSEASQSLLGASEWLLKHVEDLGLHEDNATLRAERVRLWEQFNTAWLSMAQKQKDMLESGQQIRPPHSLVTQDFIKVMVSELHGLCDGIAKHGLVDYQYGVAEDNITSALEECLDLQESREGVS